MGYSLSRTLRVVLYTPFLLAHGELRGRPKITLCFEERVEIVGGKIADRGLVHRSFVPVRLRLFFTEAVFLVRFQPGITVSRSYEATVVHSPLGDIARFLVSGKGVIYGGS